MTDKILQFPGAKSDTPAKAKPAVSKAATAKAAPLTLEPAQLEAAQAALTNLSADQQKAMQIVMSGLPFVLVGIQPTDRGADFFTAVHGEATDLRNAQPHLDGVIARAFERKNI